MQNLLQIVKYWDFLEQKNGAEKEKIDYENTKKDIMQELKKEFKPEFLNRIDEIIVFHKLEEEDMKKIASLMLENVTKRLEKQGILIDIDESVKDYVIKQGIDKNYGARPLRRVIQNTVEDNITDSILDGTLIRNVRKTMTVNGEKIEFK